MDAKITYTDCDFKTREVLLSEIIRNVTIKNRDMPDDVIMQTDFREIETIEIIQPLSD